MMLRLSALFLGLLGLGGLYFPSTLPVTPTTFGWNWLR